MNDGTGLKYLLTDHLGSVVAITDSAGTLISQQRLRSVPFGGVRTDVPSPNAPSTDFGYTGQRSLDSGMGGLMDYKARFYSPYLNRFIQPDSIIPNPSNSQAFNRYSYVMNRPVNFNDPTGHVGDGNNPCGVRKDQCGTHTNTRTASSSIVQARHHSDDDNDSSIPSLSGGSGVASGFVTPPTSDYPGSLSENGPNIDNKLLTNTELAGQAVTVGLIEVFILFPIDFALFDLTMDGVTACAAGILLACAADIPLGALDVVVADFQVSLFYEVGSNFATGTKHEFEWILIPTLLGKNEEKDK